MILNEWLALYSFWISTKVVYLQHWHGWYHMKLLPSRRNLCTPCNYAPCHVTSFEATYVRCVCVLPPALLHNDRDLLHATAVTQGWDRYQNKSQHIKQTHSWPWRTKFAPHSCWDSNLWPFDHESSALTTELSLLPIQCPTRRAWSRSTQTQSGGESFFQVQWALTTGQDHHVTQWLKEFANSIQENAQI